VPFKSKAQARFMFSQHPEMAEEWAKKTKSIKKLPEKVKSKEAKGGIAKALIEHVKKYGKKLGYGK
jgi:hypothetical protein